MVIPPLERALEVDAVGGLEWFVGGSCMVGGGGQALRLTPGQSSASLTNPGTPRGRCKGLSGERGEHSGLVLWAAPVWSVQAGILGF